MPVHKTLKTRSSVEIPMRVAYPFVSRVIKTMSYQNTNFEGRLLTKWGFILVDQLKVSVNRRIHR
jgi:hypothetical protein